jgi:hypothetical protein
LTCQGKIEVTSIDIFFDIAGRVYLFADEAFMGRGMHQHKKISHTKHYNVGYEFWMFLAYILCIANTWE